MPKATCSEHEMHGLNALLRALDVHAMTYAELLAMVMFVEPGAAADNQTLAGAQPAFLNFDIALLDEPANGSMQARPASFPMCLLRT